MRPGARRWLAPILCMLLGAAACHAGPSLPSSTRSSDGLLADAELQAVVELGIQRDMYGVMERLQAGRPEVRARAAMALASLQAVESVVALLPVLDDPEAQVRRDVAFALGRIGDPATTGALSGALSAERDATVRSRLIEALGHIGTAEAADALLAADVPPREEADRTGALAVLGGVYGVRHEGLRGHLIENLTHEDSSVRLAASSYFSLAAGIDFWATRALFLRQALDTYTLEDPAAMHLVLGLGRLHDFLDGERLRHWATEAGDWRTRSNAIAGLDPLTTSAQVLVDALDDPSPQVSFSAVRVLTKDALDQALVPHIEQWIETNPDRLQRVRELMIQLAQMDRIDAIVTWVDATEPGDDRRWAVGLEVLSYMPGEEAVTRIARAARDPSERTATAAAAALLRRWMSDRRSPETHDLYFDLFRAVIEDPRPEVAAAARRGLESTEFASRGFHVPLPAEASDGPAQREGSSVLLPDARRIDWEFLQGLGRSPSLVLETTRGTITVRLLTEEAPLTVQTVARLAQGGHYDGVPFHRVLPNFMAQGGDVVGHDGTGDPGFTIRTEVTQLPFWSGVIGMANLGFRDSENSQFFITHSRQLHLDRGYTAFGWVTDGMDVVDVIEQGDAIVSARVVPS